MASRCASGSRLAAALRDVSLRSSGDLLAAAASAVCRRSSGFLAVAALRDLSLRCSGVSLAAPFRAAARRPSGPLVAAAFRAASLRFLRASSVSVTISLPASSLAPRRVEHPRQPRPPRLGPARSCLGGAHCAAPAVLLHRHDPRLLGPQALGVSLRRGQGGERPGPHEADRPPRRIGPAVSRARLAQLDLV